MTSLTHCRYEYLFTFDNTFEIHDDIEVLKRMGMAFGLEDGKCSNEDLQKALKLVPKSLEPYVLGEMTRLMMTSLLCFCGTFRISFCADMAKVKRGDNSGLSRSVLSPDTVPSPRISDPHLLPPSTYSDNSMDSEVAGLTLPIKREPT